MLAATLNGSSVAISSLQLGSINTTYASFIGVNAIYSAEPDGSLTLVQHWPANHHQHFDSSTVSKFSPITAKPPIL